MNKMENEIEKTMRDQNAELDMAKAIADMLTSCILRSDAPDHLKVQWRIKNSMARIFNLFESITDAVVTRDREAAYAQNLEIEEYLNLMAGGMVELMEQYGIPTVKE